MVDLHTHVLPGLDDGPHGLPAALALAEAADAAGIEVLVATPHVRGDHPRVVPGEVAGRARALDAELRRCGLGVRVVPGGELGLDRALVLDDEELRAITLGANGRDLLLETPHGALPSIFADVVDGLGARGFRVTLAHPELSPDLQARPARLGALVARGALVQLTAASLVPGRAPHRALAREALRRGWVHAVASDAHAADWRPPHLDVARKACGERFAWLTGDAPAAILAGEELPALPVPGRRARRLAGLLR